ncbi:MAG: InlB B-repeat-containing protein [Lachnospiraceae bacterium]|nr:InlB B-repeat-containing protein [Lachnospiraceae bacterium]
MKKKSVWKLLLPLLLAFFVLLPGRALAAGETEVDSWSELYDALQEGGEIILTGDIKYGEGEDGEAHKTETLVIPTGTTVTLDLNGHVIDRGLDSAAVVASVIWIEPGATLNLKDSRPDAKHTPAITYTDPITSDNVNVCGGIITGGNGSYGGGITVAEITPGTYGVFNMYGGTICNNVTSDHGGGVSNDGTFNMFGGAICGNTSKRGGGVYTTQGTFNMYGGEICGNTVENTVEEEDAHGGGVYTAKAFNMNGGIISGNYKGTYINNEFKLFNDNVYMLFSNSFTWNSGTIRTGDGDSTSITDPASLGISGDPGNLDFPDVPPVTLPSVPTDSYINPPVTSLGTAGGTHYYQLTSDIELSSPLLIRGEVYLDLNGHVIDRGSTSTHYGYVVDIMPDATLSLTDSRPDAENTYTDPITSASVIIYGGIINGGWQSGVINEPNGTFKMYGGAICGNKSDFGGGVRNSGTFEMYDGAICGNTVEGTGAFGGGVINDTNGTFTMYGGMIYGNQATNGGGVNNNGTLKMYGGVICDNKATQGGGMYSNYTFSMSGGSICNNLAVCGGGLYTYSLSVGDGFKLEGGSISANRAYQGGGVYCNGKFEMKGGSIRLNVCDSKLQGEGETAANGGGVYIAAYDWSVFKPSGAAEIFDNIRKEDYGDAADNVFLKSGKMIQFDTSGLGASARIGVTTEADDPRVFTNGLSLGSSPKGTLTNFSSDNAAFSVVQSDTEAALARRGYRIIFMPNGGSGTMEPQVVLLTGADPLTAPLTANAYTRSNYSFDGWNTAADGSGDLSYSDGAEVTLTGDLTLYARWKENTSPNPPSPAKHRLTVENGSGSGSYAAGKEVSITADPAPEGLDFILWISADGGSFADAKSAGTTYRMPSKNATVTAVYGKLPVLKEGLVYNGKSQQLLTAAELTVGTPEYSLDERNWSIEVPEATAAGSYDVWYRTEGVLAAEKLGTVTIAKAVTDGATEGILELEKYYPYKEESSDSIDLRNILPSDCGDVSFGTPERSGGIVYKTEPALAEGVLSYTIAAENAEKSGSIEITAKMQNYEDVRIRVSISLQSLSLSEKLKKKLTPCSEKDIFPGKSFTLVPVFADSSIRNKRVIWYSENPDIATVSRKGMVKAQSAGSVRICAMSEEEPGMIACCVVNVKEAVTAVRTDVKKASLGIGGSFTVRAQLLPFTAEQKLEWSVNNENVKLEVAEDTMSATVIGMAAGKAKLTISASDGSKKKTVISISVGKEGSELKLGRKSDKGVKLDRKKLVIGTREESCCGSIGIATILPEGAEGCALEWTADNENVQLAAIPLGSDAAEADFAEAGKGVTTAEGCMLAVKGLKPGVTKLTAAAAGDPGKKAGCSVIVRGRETRIRLKTSAGKKGVNDVTLVEEGKYTGIMKAGGSLKLNAYVDINGTENTGDSKSLYKKYKKYTDTTVFFRSSDTAVLTVSSSGKIRVDKNAAGKTATVYVSSADGKLVAEYTLVVQ